MIVPCVMVSSFFVSVLVSLGWQWSHDPSRQFAIETADSFGKQSGIEEYADLSPSDLLVNKFNWISIPEQTLLQELAEIPKDSAVKSVGLFIAALFGSWAESPYRRNIFTDFSLIHPDYSDAKRNPNIFCFQNRLQRIVQPTLIVDPDDPNVTFWTVSNISLGAYMLMPAVIDVYIIATIWNGENAQQLRRLALRSQFMDKLRQQLTQPTFELHTEPSFSVKLYVGEEDILARTWDLYDRLVKDTPPNQLQSKGFDFDGQSRKKLRHHLEELFADRWMKIENTGDHSDVDFHFSNEAATS